MIMKHYRVTYRLHTVCRRGLRVRLHTPTHVCACSPHYLNAVRLPHPCRGPRPASLAPDAVTRRHPPSPAATRQVRNPAVHQPVEVLCEELDLDALEAQHPGLAAHVKDLPAGARRGARARARARLLSFASGALYACGARRLFANLVAARPPAPTPHPAPQAWLSPAASRAHAPGTCRPVSIVCNRPPSPPTHPPNREPPGMAIKGGIARKIVKALHGTPEPPGKYDIDVVSGGPAAASDKL